MENRLEQMGGKIGSTADVLEAQQKEQKVSAKWLSCHTEFFKIIFFIFAVIPCGVASVQIPFGIIQSVDTEIDCRLSIGRYFTH